MDARVERLPAPAPDYRRFLAAVRREETDRTPLIELAIDAQVVAELSGLPAAAFRGAGAALRLVRQSANLLHRLGHDVMKVSAPIPFVVPRRQAAAPDSLPTRQWQDQHRGVIGSVADVHNFHWPTAEDIDFRPVDAAAEALADGMALIGFAGGVLEFATDLIGLEAFMYALYDAPDMVAAVFDKVGRTIHAVFAEYCRRPAVCALWLGDDLGSKNGLLIGPEVLRKHVFPWYRRFAELAHANGRPFLLHSCGDMYAVMDDLIELGLDAKHSFEDAILPVERFADQWAGRVATLGGIDVNLLARGPQEAIAARTTDVLRHFEGRGGYACGSGNSIPDYVPASHYLAMVEAAHRWNDRIR